MVATTVRTLCRDRATLCALVFLGFVTLVAIVGPLVVSTDPNTLNLRHAWYHRIPNSGSAPMISVVISSADWLTRRA